MSKIEILIKDKKDEVKFTKALMFLVDLLDMKDKVEIKVKETETDEILQKILSRIPYVTPEEQVELERMLDKDEFVEEFSREIDI